MQAQERAATQDQSNSRITLDRSEIDAYLHPRHISGQPAQQSTDSENDYSNSGNRG
jgi:hypothetical protein